MISGSEQLHESHGGPRRKGIVFLYTSLNGFVLSVAKALAATGQVADIRIVHWKGRATSGNSYQPPETDGIRFHARDELSVEGIIGLLVANSPEIIYISGWVDRGYLAAVRQYRSMKGRGAVTVCGIDDQWRNTLRQRLGRYYFRAKLRTVFDRMWVAGAPQYHYARQFGYGDRDILYNLLSADIGALGTAGQCRRFVYVGRLEPVKGVEILMRAYAMLPSGIRECWPLWVIGDGSQRQALGAIAPDGVRFVPFLQPADLVKELSAGGVGVQPSLREQWGVSIHELVALGFPVIVSDQCGAASEFVIDGFNGFLFRSGDASALANLLRSVATMDESALATLGEASRKLGARISPETSARNLLTADAAWRSS